MKLEMQKSGRGVSLPPPNAFPPPNADELAPKPGDPPNAGWLVPKPPPPPPPKGLLGDAPNGWDPNAGVD